MKTLGKIAAALFGVFLVLMIVSVVLFSVTGDLHNVLAEFDALPGVSLGYANLGEAEQQTHDLSSIRHISIRADSCTLNVTQEEASQLTAEFCSVVSPSGKKRFHLTSSVEGDTLYLTVERGSHFDLFYFFMDSDSRLDIVLPKAYTGSLALDTSAGSAGLTGLELSGELSMRCNAGQSSLTDISCGSFRLDANAGKSSLQNLTVQGEAFINTNAGSIEGAGLSAGTLTLNGNAAKLSLERISSNLTLTGTAATFRLGYETITGDMILNGSASTATLTIPKGAPVWLEDNTNQDSHVSDSVNWTGNGKQMQEAKYAIKVDGSASTYHINEA